VEPGFYVSSLKGNVGIMPIDDNLNKECMFDVAKGPEGPGPVYTPDETNECYKCHDRAAPFL